MIAITTKNNNDHYYLSTSFFQNFKSVSTVYFLHWTLWKAIFSPEAALALLIVLMFA